uniref:RHS repeat domain-containing protein n=1 Tax=Bacteroides bouchesdurhonensis TaxID=1841855 RepID=UPI00291C5567
PKLSVRIYSLSADSLTYSQDYATGTLDCTQTTDEDGHISLEFKDRATDRVLLSRVMDGEVMLDTYYVYDGYGNLRMVLPPAASDLLTSTTTPASWIETVEAIQKYAYIYKYDGRNRCIYRKLPGCDPVYTVYDAADRPVFVQDGEQRSKGEWSFSIPDAFGRIVLTGTCKNTLDYTNDPLKNVVVKATRLKGTSQTNDLKGYTLPTQIVLTVPTVLSVNYYDRYSFIGSNGIPSGTATAYEKVAGYDELRTVGVKGLLTGTLTAKISRNGTVSGYLYSVLYYDERGRLIQQRGNNSLGGEEKVFTAYDFPGNPTQVRKVHTVGSDTKTEVFSHTYDQGERLLKTTYQLDNAAAVTLVDNTYDEVGRLKSDARNGNAKLKTEYAYNVRSWTKSITGTLFSQTLNYQEAITGNAPCYNGNISSMSWKAGGETSPRGYRFTYDGLSRLKDAIYGEGTMLAANTNRFNEQITGYDKMGNILGLKRYGQTAASSYGMIDNLTLTYNGNQLQAVKDVATSSVYGNGTEFKDGANQVVEYTYDKNGNLIKDLNKNISNIGYNLLNLPDEVTFANGNSIRYEYAADGTKLRTVHKTGSTTLTTDYCGNAVYENGVLRMLLNEAGYVSFPDRKFHFYLKDHQGNTRVVADKDGNVEETNNYYPFGGTFTSTASVQPYKYNGKELDQKNGLNWYDYGARHYDATIGRWHVVDPMSEKYYNFSLYNYCANNPMSYVDYKGDSISLAGLQQLDKQLNSNYTQTIVNDLQSQTGLTIAVAANGSMSYAKDANGNPVIATTTDTNGSTVQIGSATARKLITESINHSDWVSVIPGKSGVVPGTNDIGLNYKQIDSFINETVGLDNKTLGWGMTFMHELHHTQVGGGLRDIPGNPGPVVSQMNIIRSELNTLGGNYGQRLDYMATPVGAYNYIPFNKPSQSLLSVGLAPISMYVKFK